MRLFTPKNKPYVLFLLWVGIIFTLSLWLVSPPDMPRNVRVTTRQDKWSLPKANATAEMEQMYSKVAPWKLFHNKTDASKQKKGPPPPPPPPPPSPKKPKVIWRLDGIISIGGERIAVIGAKDEHRQYKEGALLPNDERLLTIQADHITISDADKERTVKLFDLSNKAPSLEEEPESKKAPPPKK